MHTILLITCRRSGANEAAPHMHKLPHIGDICLTLAMATAMLISGDAATIPWHTDS